MALRSHVSRIAARGTVTTPAAENSAADTEQTETSAAETIERETPVRSNRYAGASRAPAQEEPRVSEPESTEPSTAEKPAARRGRPPIDRTKAKKSLQTTPALTGTESISELRAKVKEVEQLIKDARTRHDEEMKTLKSVYSDLHARMFDHVK